MWHETIASRGSPEIGSCIMTWFQKMAACNELPRKIAAYSDSCGGQNRNIVIALMWMLVVQVLKLTLLISYIMLVNIRFFRLTKTLVFLKKKSGSSNVFMSHSNFRFGSEWGTISERARKTGHKFEVLQMKSEDF